MSTFEIIVSLLLLALALGVWRVSHEMFVLVEILGSDIVEQTLEEMHNGDTSSQE